MCFYKIVLRVPGYPNIYNFGYPVLKITENAQPYKFIVIFVFCINSYECNYNTKPSNPGCDRGTCVLEQDTLLCFFSSPRSINGCIGAVYSPGN